MYCRMLDERKTDISLSHVQYARFRNYILTGLEPIPNPH